MVGESTVKMVGFGNGIGSPEVWAEAIRFIVKFGRWKNDEDGFVFFRGVFLFCFETT